MTEQDFKHSDFPSEMTETFLGASETGFPAVPEPSKWDSSYGIDEAVAIAVVPERVLVFWELASIIAVGCDENCKFRLTRIRLEGEVPTEEMSWSVRPVGRFQDSSVEAGTDYLYVISMTGEKVETKVMVTNPVRTPIRHVPSKTGTRLPSSFDLYGIRIKLREGGEQK